MCNVRVNCDTCLFFFSVLPPFHFFPLQQTTGWCAVDTYEMLRKRILATIKAKLEAPALPEVNQTSETL